MKRCPLCDGVEIRETVRRERVPAMQNYVYRTRASAESAPEGRLSLLACDGCGFAWNGDFDPGRLVYDVGYDNAVPSEVMRSYYRDLATYLRDRYDLEGGLIVDIGCGNGAFLEAICAAVPEARGLGVDPALERSRGSSGGRITFVKSAFTPELVSEPPVLVVCRHVLEHIPGPVDFLRTIAEALAAYGSTPCFFEVPDLDWMLRNNVFWDFCYEHCNYFVDSSLAGALRRAGFEPTRTRAAFGSQYRWMEALLARRQAVDTAAPGSDTADRIAAYAAGEAANVAAMRAQLREWKSEGYTIAVWGMATKGVLFSVLVDPEASLIDFCIDVNPNKHNCFVPLTGHAISSPTALRNDGSDRAVVVVVMNDLYRDEVARTCRELGVDATVVSITSLMAEPARDRAAPGR
jgi:SAM-dependent methyltransferase